MDECLSCGGGERWTETGDVSEGEEGCCSDLFDSRVRPVSRMNPRLWVWEEGIRGELSMFGRTC